MRRVPRNIAINLVGQLAVLALGFVSARFVFKALGGDALGVIYFALTLNAVLCAILDLGISSTIIREVSGAGDDHRSPYVLTVLRTAGALYWGSYVVVTLAVVIGAPLFAGYWLTLTTMEPATAASMLRILGAGAFLALPRSLYVAALRGAQRMEITNSIDVGSSVLQQAGAIVLLRSGGDAFAVACWYAATYSGALLAYLLAVARTFSARAVVPGFAIEAIRKSRSFSKNMMAVTILKLVHTQADKLILSRLMPASQFGIYTFVNTSVGKGGILTGAVSQALLPALTQLVAHREHDRLRLEYGRAHDLLCLALVPIYAAVPFAALPVFGFVFDAETAARLLAPAALLAVGFYLNGCLSVPYVLTLAQGRPDLPARLNFAGLFVVLPVVVGGVYAFGLVGAAASWVFYQLFAFAYFIPRFSRECLQVSPRGWFVHLGVRVAGALLVYGVAWGALELYGGTSIVSLLIAYLAATAAFLAGSFRTIRSHLPGRSSAVYVRA